MRWSFVCLSLLAACNRPTELVVIVDSDLIAPDELDEVVVTITGPSGTPIEARQLLGDGQPMLPLTLGVTPAGDALGPIDVVADGMLGGSQIVTRSARTTLLPGRSLALYVFLSRDCRGVMCGAGETCTENGCASTDVDPEDLPPWNGRITIPSDAGIDGAVPPMPCESGADCDDGIDCTRDVCMDEVCTNLADDTMCTLAAEGFCDADDGCQYATCNAATCTAGPCQTAECVGTMCERTSSCGAGETCCNDACVMAGCNDGNPCTDDACGATGCTNTPNTASCDDGVFCNGGEVCGGGSCASPGNPCSGSAVCDEDANVCTGCGSSEDCGPPVYGTWDACEGFTDGCDETGTRSRGVSTFTCDAGTCTSAASIDSEDCMRDTDGVGCGGQSCTNYGSCGGFSDICDESGIETRQCTDYACNAGTCQGTARDDSRSCSRTTGGTECQATSCEACTGACGGFDDVCDEYGTCDRACTDYRCGGGTCQSSGRTEAIDCTRNTDGVACYDGVDCSGNDVCSGGTCSGATDLCPAPWCFCDPAINNCRDSMGGGFCPV